MNIQFETYNRVTEESKYIRNTVFVIEQGFKEEFDDGDKTAIHVLLRIDGVAVGTSRIIYSDKHQCYSIGRVAILKEYRSQGLGSKIMRFSEKEIIERFGHIQIGVSSQEHAIPFYQKIGYQCVGDKYMDQHCPHIWMIKQL